jgi:hypothetical protein
VLVRVAVVGHLIDPWAAADGVVLGVHASAVNLTVADRLWTVLPDTGRPGPRRLLLAQGVLQLPVSPGDPVDVRAGRVRVGPVTLDGRTSAVWSSEPVGPATVGTPARLAGVGLGNPWPEATDLLDALVAALLTAGAGSRPAATALLRLVGAGPGLTPSGDDALLGLVTGLSGVGSPLAAATLSWLRDQPRSTWDRTTTVSALMMREALDGELSEPLLSLVAALRSGRDPAPHLAAVVATGATSGADTCQGLAAAGRLLAAEGCTSVRTSATAERPVV